MFCIICVKVCEIVVWFDEMVQFRNCSFEAWIDVGVDNFDCSWSTFVKNVSFDEKRGFLMKWGVGHQKASMFYLQETTSMSNDNPHEELKCDAQQKHGWCQPKIFQFLHFFLQN